MKIRYLCLGFALTWASSVSAIPYFISTDVPSKNFTGKYFESKGQFYLKNRQYQSALEMFQLSGYWADKVSQYNTGIMYFNGIGIAIDKARGVAWLRIAAQRHDDLAEQALKAATAELSAEELGNAGRLEQELDAKYGDKVSLPRALKRFRQDRVETTGSHLGFVSKAKVTTAGDTGAMGEDASTFFADVDKKHDEFISNFTGHVTVGSVRSLPVAQEARNNASQTPLNSPENQK